MSHPDTIQIINPSTFNKLGYRHARRLVETGRARWTRGGAAVWLIRKTDVTGRPSMDAARMRTAGMHELAGVPVVAAGKLLGMGSRSAGPPYRGGKMGGPRTR